MSKVGRMPIAITSGVTVTVTGPLVTVQGPKGSVEISVPSEISVSIQDSVCEVSVKKRTANASALHGLTRTLIANAVHGVAEEWRKILEIQGTGFRAVMEGNNLVVRVGYSHPVTFPTPHGVTLQVKGNKITVQGVDKQRVGEVASLIRSIRVPDRYKGKGIRYEGEIIRLKPGKKAKTTA